MAEGIAGAVVFLRDRDDDQVADAPAGDGFGEGDGGGAGRGVRAEFHPRAAERRAVRVPAAAARDDGGEGFDVHAFEMFEADGGGEGGGDGIIRRADFECGEHLAGGGGGGRRGVVAVEAVFGGGVAGFNLDEAGVEARGFVAGEGELAGDVDHADGGVGVGVVDDGVAGANLDAVAGARGAGIGPGGDVGPLAVTRGDGVEFQRLGGRGGNDEVQREGEGEQGEGEGFHERRE